MKHAWSGLAILALLSGGPARAEEQPGARLVVHVLDESDAPVSGAQVLVWGREVKRSGSTNAAGRLRLADVTPADVTVFATAEGFVGTERRSLSLEAGAVAEIRLQLSRGIPFDGRVLDGDEQPVEGACVEVMPGGTFEGTGQLFPARTPYDRVWTDAAGRFRVRGIPRDGIATLLVHSPLHRESRVAVKSFGDAVRPSPLIVRLERGARIVGVVRDDEGRLVAGARVYVVPAGAEELRLNPRMVCASTTGETLRALRAQTDERGAFAVVGIGLGEAHLVLAEAEGFALTEADGVFVATEASPHLEAEIFLHRPGTLLVRLKDELGKPVRDAKVRIGGYMTRTDWAEGDEDGVYRFDSLRPGSHRVGVETERFRPAERSVDVRPGKPTEIEVVLDPGAHLSGVLVDESGRPKEGVSVRVEWWEESSSGWRALVVRASETGAEGRFEIRGLEPGDYRIEVRAAGFNLSEPVEVTAPATGLRIVGRCLGRVRLRLVPPGGLTLPESLYVWRFDATGSGYGSGQRHEEGVVEFHGFEGTKERLRLQMDGYVEIALELEVAPGETRDLGDIPLDPGVTLRGSVTDLAGAPVAGAVVDHGGYREATTQADGSFALPHVPTGAIEVSVDAEGFLSSTEEVEAGKGAKAVTLRVHRGALLEGVLHDREGKTLEEHWVRVEHPLDAGWEEVDYFSTDEDGAFRIRVPAGRCRLAFYAERGAEPAVLAELDLAEGEARTLSLVLAEHE